MLLSLIASLAVIEINKFYPSVFAGMIALVKSLDFYTLLMKMILSFLLFAGAIHMDASALKKEGLTIFTFSTVGLLISNCVVGSLFYLAAQLLGLHINFISCLLFGSLISPTDPIAVLGI